MVLSQIRTVTDYSVYYIYEGTQSLKIAVVRYLVNNERCVKTLASSQAYILVVSNRLGVPVDKRKNNRNNMQEQVPDRVGARDKSILALKSKDSTEAAASSNRHAEPATILPQAISIVERGRFVSRHSRVDLLAGHNAAPRLVLPTLVDAIAHRPPRCNRDKNSRKTEWPCHWTNPSWKGRNRLAGVLGCWGATVGRLCLCYVLLVSGHRHHNGSAFVDLAGLCAGEFTRFDQQPANAHHSLVDA